VSQQPQHHELSDHEVLLNLVDRATEFLKKNGLHILVVLLIFTLAAVLLRTAHFRRVGQANVAWNALAALPESTILAHDMVLGDPTEIAVQRQDAMAKCRALLEGPETEATPWILYKLGNLESAAGDWTAALSTYERLLREYPESGAAEAAEGAMAAALEDSGDYRGAAQAYERAATNGISLYLVDAGRAWELAGDAGAAERCYNAALGAGVGERYEGLVATRLEGVREGALLPEPPAFKTPELPARPELGPVLVPADTEAGPDIAPLESPLEVE
jgi:tetratricopeptide (TPR) repeat protein